MSVSQQHFEAIAWTIYTSESFATPEAREKFAHEIATCLSGFNSRLKRDRFVRACMTGKMH